MGKKVMRIGTVESGFAGTFHLEALKRVLNILPHEGWFNGYQHELDAFYDCMANNKPFQSDSTLAADVIATIYVGYVSAEKKGVETIIPKIQ